MIIQGQLNAKELKIGIVVSRFNELINKKLLEGALDCLLRNGAIQDDIDVMYVPGAFEIPLGAKHLLETKKYDAIITLGAVIRGATSHYDLVANEVAKGVAHLSLEYNKPVLFGVLTTDTIDQALERAGTKAGNKGFEVALGAIEMANIFR